MTLEEARQRIQELEREKRELVFALAQHRLVLEHYLTVCAAVGADPSPALEALAEAPRVSIGPTLFRVK